MSTLHREISQILTLQASHGDAALARAAEFGRWRAGDVRSVLAAAGAVPMPRSAGEVVVLTLHAVPVRLLSDYAIGGDQ